jgi:type IV secretory pathway TraG/TraD family ATPase VirD4
MASTEEGEVFTENIVEVLKTVINTNTTENRSNDSFWENSLDMLLKNIINLCRLAYGRVTVQLLYDIVSSIPKPQYTEKEKEEKLSKPFFVAYVKARANVKAQIDDLETYHSRTQNGRKINLSQDEMDEIEDVRTFSHIDSFFFETLKELADKTKSIVIFSFKSFLFDLLQEPTYSLFCKSKSNVTPLDCLDGKIILLNLPVKKYHKAGKSCQILFKYIWQREMEKRVISPDSKALFLVADESQLFIHEKDAEFQATARSSRICTLYITQNIPNYRARMGGHNANDLVLGFLGTLSNKVFHANSCSTTNRYASELLGQVYYEKKSESTSFGGDKKFTSGTSSSLELKSVIRPEEFSSFTTGGTANEKKVTAIIHCQGDAKFGNKNYAKVTFEQ